MLRCNIFYIGTYDFNNKTISIIKYSNNRYKSTYYLKKKIVMHKY